MEMTKKYILYPEIKVFSELSLSQFQSQSPSLSTLLAPETRESVTGGTLLLGCGVGRSLAPEPLEYADRLFSLSERCGVSDSNEL